MTMTFDEWAREPEGVAEDWADIFSLKIQWQLRCSQSSLT